MNTQYHPAKLSGTWHLYRGRETQCGQSVEWNPGIVTSGQDPEMTGRKCQTCFPLEPPPSIPGKSQVWMPEVGDISFTPACATTWAAASAEALRAGFDYYALRNHPNSCVWQVSSGRPVCSVSDLQEEPRLPAKEACTP